MKKFLCIYHGNCADGFSAAWVVRKALGEENVEFHAGVYQNPPPDVANRHVVIVDFSYKRPVMEEIVAKCASLCVLDHHKSAMADLDGLHGAHEKVEVYFDMERSGAMMAWQYFFKDRMPPQFIRHIQDRDLWLFKLDGTREIQVSIFSFPYDFKVWDRLVEQCDTEDGWHAMRIEGIGIERKHHKDIAELVGVSKRRMTIGGHDVPVANLPYTLSSDAGHKMAKGEPFAACYMDTPQGRVFSLRSADDGVDVSEIAKLYGGGGHARAAGFRKEVGWEGEAR